MLVIFEICYHLLLVPLCTGNFSIILAPQLLYTCFSGASKRVGVIKVVIINAIDITAMTIIAFMVVIVIIVVVTVSFSLDNPAIVRFPICFILVLAHCQLQLNHGL